MMRYKKDLKVRINKPPAIIDTTATCIETNRVECININDSGIEYHTVDEFKQFFKKAKSDNFIQSERTNYVIVYAHEANTQYPISIRYDDIWDPDGFKNAKSNYCTIVPLKLGMVYICRYATLILPGFELGTYIDPICAIDINQDKLDRILYTFEISGLFDKTTEVNEEKARFLAPYIYSKTYMYHDLDYKSGAKVLAEEFLKFNERRGIEFALDHIYKAVTPTDYDFRNMEYSKVYREYWHSQDKYIDYILVRYRYDRYKTAHKYHTQRDLVAWFDALMQRYEKAVIKKKIKPVDEDVDDNPLAKIERYLYYRETLNNSDRLRSVMCRLNRKEWYADATKV